MSGVILRESKINFQINYLKCSDLYIQSNRTIICAEPETNKSEISE